MLLGLQIFRTPPLILTHYGLNFIIIFFIKHLEVSLQIYWYFLQSKDQVMFPIVVRSIPQFIEWIQGSSQALLPFLLYNYSQIFLMSQMITELLYQLPFIWYASISFPFTFQIFVFQKLIDFNHEKVSDLKHHLQKKKGLTEERHGSSQHQYF